MEQDSLLVLVTEIQGDIDKIVIFGCVIMGLANLTYIFRLFRWFK